MKSNLAFINNIQSDGFLSPFIIQSRETPNGPNGECIIHYQRNGRKYELIVPLVNGRKEGEAVMLHNGALYLKLHYLNNQLMGPVERMNEYGMTEMRGYLVNGLESGLFREYDKEGKVVWIGYYRNGQRYSEVMKAKHRKGY